MGCNYIATKFNMQAEINSKEDILDFTADNNLANLLKTVSIADHENSRSEEALRSHWPNQGLDRSIHASAICSRQDFLNLMNPRDELLLEIGLFLILPSSAMIEA